MLTKQDIRRLYKQKRASMSKRDVVYKSAVIVDTFLATDIYKNCSCVMLYIPIGNEADTRQIIVNAYCDGKKLVFPVTDSSTGVITPMISVRDTDFSKGAFSIMEPVGGSVVPVEQIDVILVPGIAFDAKGARIGYGKGCYDRLLGQYTGVKVGYCYRDQLCEHIPADEYDIYMDYIITENGLIECK